MGVRPSQLTWLERKRPRLFLRIESAHLRYSPEATTIKEFPDARDYLQGQARTRMFRLSTICTCRLPPARWFLSALALMFSEMERRIPVRTPWICPLGPITYWGLEMACTSICGAPCRTPR